MVDLNTMSPAARSAAMRGGVDDWGSVGGLPGQIRYDEPVDSKSRRCCKCGCAQRATHRGMANGVCVTMGCDLSMRRWVKEGNRG
jgi:hypothetical protein